MAQHLVNRRGYWSLERSVRVPGRKHPVKETIEYYGKRPMRLRDIDWGASLVGEPGDGAASKAEWDAIQATPVEETSSLPVGLHTGPTDPVPADVSPSEPSSPASSEPAASQEAASDSPDASSEAEPSADEGASSAT